MVHVYFSYPLYSGPPEIYIPLLPSLQCDPDGRLGNDQQLVFINPKKSVEQIGNDPLLVLNDVV